jgi:GntR family transcriptional regulator
MFFNVDPSSGVPIYSQIVRQVKFAIAEQSLRPGGLLPSVRQLSQQLMVNPNTVSRALQQLQSEGIVEALRGRGMVVCRGAVAQCRKERKLIIAERIEQVMSEALQAGMNEDDIRCIVDKKIASVSRDLTSVAASPPDE